MNYLFFGFFLFILVFVKEYPNVFEIFPKNISSITKTKINTDYFLTTSSFFILFDFLNVLGYTLKENCISELGCAFDIIMVFCYFILFFLGF
jgi:hypothetical protein